MAMSKGALMARAQTISQSQAQAVLHQSGMGSSRGIASGGGYGQGGGGGAGPPSQGAGSGASGGELTPRRSGRLAGAAQETLLGGGSQGVGA